MHGIGSRWQMWQPVLGHLAERHDVIAVDLPGFGASPMPPPGTPPGIDSQVRLVTEFLAELGVERPHVAGNSMGGLIALEMAARGLARSATALSPSGFANRAEMSYGRASLWITVRVARRTAPLADTLFATAFGRRLGLSLFVARPERLTAAEAADNTRALADAPGFDETLPALTPFQFSGREPIAVPVTVAWGSKDRLLLPRQARRGPGRFRAPVCSCCRAAATCRPGMTPSRWPESSSTARPPRAPRRWRPAGPDRRPTRSTSPGTAPPRSRPARGPGRCGRP